MRDGWVIDESELPTRDADALSSIFCVGNGATTTRGTLSEEGADAFRGVYVSGLEDPRYRRTRDDPVRA
jgi:trehalose/maltose hydrolase-like predicted phosphorylase